MAGLGCSVRLFILWPLKLEKLLSLDEDTVSGLLASSFKDSLRGVMDLLLSIGSVL